MADLVRFILFFNFLKIFQGMNLSKREQCSYVAPENLTRHIKNPKLKRVEPIGSIYEVVKRKNVIQDSIPIHLGNFFSIFYLQKSLSIQYFGQC